MLIPALDIIEGQVVRLQKGDFNQQTNYHSDPVAVARDYQAQGADYLHLVDLDGARAPKLRQLALITQLVQQLDIPVQVGGGVRHREDIQQLLAAGVARVVIGSTAVNQPTLVKEWFQEFGGERLVLALDVNINQQGQRMLATHGWQTTSQQQLEPCLQAYLDVGCQHVLCTDISRDGMLQGSNVALYQELKQAFPSIQWQASGGVASLAELTELQAAQCDSVILGKSLLTNTFTLAEALACWNNASSPVSM
ncbi:1-(5-phosphoribosyl)-5-[(5-phosphoribosylamino)methylideneamino]imidazole-4-carboxamide isomerase [Aliidiomarina taiwanensis]|uniref:1-(5-phosphoribosyl)-5-[(5-phosphoribosylamino)methylideneamino] imidazole-4-carboxamide isomerase n=1 Tax=Aliidiomarina taiwanensis TaxID=946228 RepID=A0A432X214_9GAMM|nr:1-(5-phosphoribosyl)-5-[(5-phosphoribosylamino)methylideneamino]imidazole-4-carboxamide isomerase [Aliidiomarina taiwanensis]RUO40585.1 1-(5-phosphoribosyl)-5-[(5-phosphoribosylamino)methylideneamino]imidazole-4-carboxamide isomerase [Aliidiomarina taiwanensis]